MKVKKGFTIIELSISIVFLSILLLTIAFLIINMISIYQKGLTLKSVSSAGSEIIDEVSRAISAAPTTNINRVCELLKNDSERRKCEEDGAYYKAYHQISDLFELANPKGGVDIKRELPVYGGFCTGRFSYIWNTAYTFPLAWEGSSLPKNFSSIKKATLRYRLKGDPNERELKNFRLIRIADYNRQVCSNKAGDYSSAHSPEYDLRAFDLESEPAEVLDSSEDNLALYDFKIFRPARHKLTNHSFYSGTFILATIRGGIDITGSGDYCQEPQRNTLSTDFSYCAINKFNFAIRATGQDNRKERI